MSSTYVAAILLRELLEGHRGCRVSIDAGMAAHFPKLSSNDAAITPEATWELRKLHALAADASMPVLKPSTLTSQEVGLKLLVFDRQQLHHFTERQHFRQDGLDVFLKEQQWNNVVLERVSVNTTASPIS